MSDSAALVWVVGARGLLGGAVVRAVHASPCHTLLPAPPLPWGDPEALEIAAAEIATELVRDSRSTGAAPLVVWCAGTGTTSSPREVFDAEEADLETVLTALEVAGSTAGPVLAGPVFAYASSAGGVYAGAVSPPFTETTVPRPISEYGRSKLRSEARLAAWSERSGWGSLIARIANLYGPGQRLDKPQGLISQIARAQFSPTPVSIFMPLDTMRDYITADDCAQRLLAGCDLARRQEIVSMTKIFAGGSPITIGELLGLAHRVSKRRPRVVLGASPQAAVQAVDLRLRSEVWPEIDVIGRTPLAAGVSATMSDVVRQLAAG